MSSDSQSNATSRPGWGLLGTIAAGIIIVGGIAVWAMGSGGLPGTKDSPSATVHGQPTTGRTGSD